MEGCSAPDYVRKGARAGRFFLRCVRAALELEPEGPQRSTRIARRLGVGPRNVQLALAQLRREGLDVPRAPSGRPQRDDYEYSRRGERRHRENRDQGIAVSDTKPRSPDRGFPPAHLTPPPLSRSESSFHPSNVSDQPVRKVIPLAGDELAIVRSFGEGGREASKVVRMIRRAWPEASPAEAGVALRMFLKRPEATLERAVLYFQIAPGLNRIDRSAAPWRACTAAHRVDPWIRRQLRREAPKREDEARTLADRDGVPMPENVRARAQSLGLLKRTR